MNNDYLASKQNYYTEPVYTGRALHAKPVKLFIGGALFPEPVKLYAGVQQSWFRMLMSPMFIIILVCIISFIFLLYWYNIYPKWYLKNLKNCYNFEG